MPLEMIVDLAARMGADLLVIGATGHSALYERLIAQDRVTFLLGPYSSQLTVAAVPVNPANPIPLVDMLWPGSWMTWWR